ncbi:permease-like protein [Angomonas deanei]|nr:permease-like protein [Angomonas deanei]|eukprot:EPY30246.1 permease-like protein [Angomonas deanei]
MEQSSTNIAQPDESRVPVPSRDVSTFDMQPYLEEMRKEKKANKSAVGTLWSTVVTSVRYTYADIRKRPRNAFIGAAAVFILVFFSGLVLTALYKTPYIILRLAELNAGEADFSFEATGGLLNYSRIASRLDENQEVRGVSPRWSMKAQLDAVPKLPFFDLFDEKSDPPVVTPRTTVVILVVDTERETQIGIGRDWKYRPTGYGETSLYYAATDYLNVRPQRGERVSFQLDTKSLSSLVGTDVYVSVPSLVNTSTDLLSAYLRSFLDMNGLPRDRVSLFDVATASFSAVVVDAFDGANGKYPSALGNVALVDYKQLVRLLLEESCAFGGSVGPKTSLLYSQWNPEGESSPLNDTVMSAYAFATSLHDLIKNFNLVENAMSILATLRYRYRYYYADTSDRTKMLIHATNRVMVDVGVDLSASVSYSLNAVYEQFDLFKVLVVTSFATVVGGMILLGVLLLLSLLRINAEERQYEIAMLRTQGMPKGRIGGLLIVQTVAFALPASAVGTLLVFLFNIVLEALLSSFTKAPANYLSFPAFVPIFCICEGLVMPLVATWPSIKRALSSSLRDALDIYREETNETTVKMIKLSKLGLETWEIVVGVFLVVAGFVVYYLVPVSFVFQQFLLFFFQLDFVLACMVVGLCLIFSVTQNLVQRGIVKCILWGKERRLLTLVEKNLATHKQANKKAFMMFLLSVASLCAGGIMFSVLASLASQLSELIAGSEVSIVSASHKAPLDVTELNHFLKTVGSAYVANWAYSSFPLTEHPSFASSKLRNAAGAEFNMKVTALSEYFMESTYDSYNIVTEVNEAYAYEKDSKGNPMVVQSMYRDPPPHPDTHEAKPSFVTGLVDASDPGRLSDDDKKPIIPILIGDTVKDRLGTGVDDTLSLLFSYWLRDSQMRNETMWVESFFVLQPRALMKRVSGFFLISPLTFSAGSILVTNTSMQHMLDAVQYDLSSSERERFLPPGDRPSVVLQKVLYVKLKSNVTKRERERFVNLIQPYTNVVFHTTVDTAGLVEDLAGIRNAILYFFYFIAVICTLLCAFMLWVTFIANVQLQLWTYGVLRSLGFRNAQLIRACIYEALSIVLTAFVCGLAVGCIVGLSVARQLSTFMSLPYTVNFPFFLVALILILCLLAAIVGSAMPLLLSKKRSIASVIKGV